MHRFVAGTCTMTLHIVPQGPWMVRGETRKESFRNHRGQQDERDVLHPLQNAQGYPVLPASSFKGVLRSTAERILRSMQPERSPELVPLADDPFVHDANDLPQKQRGHIADSELKEWNNHRHCYTNEQLAPERVFLLLSPASQLFGCTLHAGLVTLDDAQVQQKTTQRRSHVALDRFTGGVGEGPFIEELAPAKLPLRTTLTITNFALWQIGLLALVFQEINRGYVHLGGGTRKGQGQVTIAIPQITFQYAEAIYANSAGVISAQARLAHAPWNEQVPDPVQQVEAELALLPDLQPQISQGWREAGMTVLIAQETTVQRLFAEAVRHAWCEWIEVMTQEERV